jgi:uncharacterized membrane protein YhhN
VLQFKDHSFPINVIQMLLTFLVGLAFAWRLGWDVRWSLLVYAGSAALLLCTLLALLAKRIARSLFLWSWWAGIILYLAGYAVFIANGSLFVE